MAPYWACGIGCGNGPQKFLHPQAMERVLGDLRTQGHRLGMQNEAAATDQNNEYGLSGQFSHIPLIDILNLLKERRLTGCLHIHNYQNVNVWVQDGTVAAAYPQRLDQQCEIIHSLRLKMLMKQRTTSDLPLIAVAQSKGMEEGHISGSGRRINQ